MKYKLQIIILFIAGTILVSCKKKIVESIMVYERTEISIPNVTDIKSISFPTKDVGYAITDKGTFKTSNGGGTWSKIDSYTNGFISFYDANYGVISTGYVTTDGGVTWNFLVSAEAVSVTNDGRIVVLEKDSWNKMSIWVSEIGETDVQFKTSFYYTRSKLDRIECHGDYVYIFPKDFLLDNLEAYNYKDGSEFEIFEQYTAAEKITGLCVYSNEITICGEDGFIGDAIVPSNSGFGTVYRSFFSHTNPFYAVDNYNDLVVAVGKNAIATNKVYYTDDEDFKDVFQPSLDGFDETFILVDVINENNIVTVTSSAKIYKGKI